MWDHHTLDARRYYVCAITLAAKHDRRMNCIGGVAAGARHLTQRFTIIVAWMFRGMRANAASGISMSHFASQCGN